MIFVVVVRDVLNMRRKLLLSNLTPGEGVVMWWVGSLNVTRYVVVWQVIGAGPQTIDDPFKTLRRSECAWCLNDPKLGGGVAERFDGGLSTVKCQIVMNRCSYSILG